MDPLLRVGLELPALAAPLPARTSERGVKADGLSTWRSTAVAAAATGYFGAVWATGGPGADVGSGEGPTCDACTLAGGLVGSVPDALLGVVAAIGPGRHPAVLARDVTALDVVSGGRAAVLLCASGVLAPAGVAGAPSGAAPTGAAPTGAGPSGAGTTTEEPTGAEVQVDRLWALAEAAAVCRALFTEDHPVFEGRFFHVAGAVNRPGPVQAGGPPLLVQLPSWSRDPELPPHAAEGGAAAAALALVARVADAVVVTGSPGEVAAWRRVLDGATGAFGPAPAGTGAGVPIVWRGRIRAAAEAADAVDRVVELAAAGAGGLIVRAEPDGGSAAVRALVEVLSTVFPGTA